MGKRKNQWSWRENSLIIKSEKQKIKINQGKKSEQSLRDIRNYALWKKREKNGSESLFEKMTKVIQGHPNIRSSINSKWETLHTFQRKNNG